MQSRMTKRLVAVSMATALAAGLVGCSGPDGGGDGGEGGVTITFWDHSGNPTRAETYEALIEEFEKTHEGITVDFLTLPSDSAFEKIQTSLASSDAPDIASLSGTFVAPFTGQDALLNLDDRFADSPLADELEPGLVDVMRNDSRDGGLYALPYTLTYGIMWYRTDLWAEAGYPDGPATWDDFYAGAEKLTSPKDGQYGFAMRGGAGGVFQFLQAMYAQSGVETLFDDDGVSTIDDPANLEAFTQYVGLYKNATSEADLGYGYPDMVAAFDSGAAASLQHNLGSYGEHAATLGENFAGIPLPESADGKRVVITDPIPSFAIFKETEHPDETWEFLEFMLSESSNGALNETIGQIPSNIESRSEAWVSDLQSVSAASEWMNGDVTLMSAPTYLPDYGTIMRNEMEPELQRVLLGELDPADFLHSWADRMTEAQQAYLGDK
ncbi:sugar ABC transporter substrate-binding protein [Microbacterium soli]|uniref:Sugar ABC transporter substrate-binding protein n=1 Tax=Microbacterium soli TaxID=446075 RepID=A0ABP7N4L9_9MICO